MYSTKFDLSRFDSFLLDLIGVLKKKTKKFRFIASESSSPKAKIVLGRPNTLNRRAHCRFFWNKFFFKLILFKHFHNRFSNFLRISLSYIDSFNQSKFWIQFLEVLFNKFAKYFETCFVEFSSTKFSHTHTLYNVHWIQKERSLSLYLVFIEHSPCASMQNKLQMHLSENKNGKNVANKIDGRRSSFVRKISTFEK